MKIVCISDIHGFLPESGVIPACDLLIIAGDVCPLWNHERQFQALWLRSDFSDWLNALKDQGVDKIVGVAGNHDFVLEASRDFGDNLPWEYLENEPKKIAGVNIFGSPMSNRFGNWAFMAEEPVLKYKHWNLIPDETEILIVHGPPFGYGDKVNGRYLTFAEDPSGHVGSKSLTEKIESLPNLRLVVCGHIHEGHGIYDLDDVKIVNAAYCDDIYSENKFKPIVLNRNEGEYVQEEV